MECFIDGKSTCERTFWNRLNVLANFQQKEMIMDGLKVRVAEGYPNFLGGSNLGGQSGGQ